jgi:hypothetical protein
MSRVRPSFVRAALTSLIMTGALGTGAAFAATDVGSVNFTLGRKSLSNDWNPGPPTADTTERVGQPALGLELTWGRQGWPAMVALDVFHSYDDGIIHVPAFFTEPAFDVRLRMRTLEIGLGVRRAWTVLGWSPYLGAGGSWVRGSVVYEVSDPLGDQFGAPLASARAHATAFGYWAGGGIYRRMGPRFQLGLAGRYSKATLPVTDLILDDVTPTTVIDQISEIDAGGRHINLVVGWSFPSRK